MDNVNKGRKTEVSDDKDVMQTTRFNGSEYEQNQEKINKNDSDANGEQTSTMHVPGVSLQMDEDDRLFHYDVFENPPIPMTVFFALQVML